MATYSTAAASPLEPTPTGASPNFTFSYTPTAVRSFSIWLLGAAPTTLSVAAVADNRGNKWAQLAPPFISAQGLALSLWSCQSVATTAATVTVTNVGTGSLTNGLAIGKEFTSTATANFEWVVDQPGVIVDKASSTTLTGNTVDTTEPGCVIYEGMVPISGTGVVGSTSGFVYHLDAGTNVFCWAVNSTGAPQTPTATLSPAAIYTVFSVAFKSHLWVPPGVGAGIN